MAIRTGLFLATILTAACLCNAQQNGAQSKITDFGAVADGKTLNTIAIQKTIDHLAQSGGGTVIVPEGVFMSGSIFLKPGVNLHVEKNGILKGTTNIADYPEMNTRIEGHFQPWLPALVNADKVDHLSIGGEGTLEGGGQFFWDAFRNTASTVRGTKNLDVPRPRMIFIRDSAHVTVKGLHLKDSGFWNLHIYNCHDVTIDGLDIVAGPRSPSTDGIDVDSCQNVTITNCHIANNDDCIALKGSKGPLAMDDKASPPVEHIRVSNCTFERGGSFVTCGSEATIVRDVVIENCSAPGPNNSVSAVLRLKLRTDTPQLYENITVRNITLDGRGTVLAIAKWEQYFDLQGHPQPSRQVKNVTISNVKGSFGSLAGRGVGGGPGDTIENVTLENIDLTTNGQIQPNLSMIKNLVVKNVKVNGKDFDPSAPPTPAPPGRGGGRGRGFNPTSLPSPQQQ
ncbi:MAG TPA: glycosyl hydrolase family 28 protein [Tepidisphaeraceae bacterium]|nr:glycosyl hydrolase family 28 protein [Tepidisphaeraceae bacterium]